MERFSEISEDTIKTFMEVFNKKSFPLPIKFQFINDSKSKKLVNIVKLPEDIAFILDKDLKVSINEDLLEVYDEESISILIDQEIDKVNYNLDSGKIKIVKPDLNTFSSILNKYGVEKVTKANQVEELYDKQKKDNKNEFIV